MLHLCLHVSKLPTSFFWHCADGGPARVLSNLVRRCSRITSHPRISPSKHTHTHILIPLYSIIRPMCLGPQRKQAFLYMTRMSLIFMEVNKCTCMEGVFHSWRLTMGPLCSLISCTLTFLPHTTRYEWTLCFLDNIFIWEGYLKYAQVIRYRVDLPYTPSLFLAALVLILVFKRQYCWIFFSQKLHFVRRLWQIAAAAQNGLVHYMSYVKSELFKSCTSPKTHLCLSSPQGCNGIQPCQLNILVFLHILWQFHINLFTSMQSSVPCYRNNTLRPL